VAPSPPFLLHPQLTNVRPLGTTGKYTATLSDGADQIEAVLSTQVR
jgi:hypothetical protein